MYGVIDVGSNSIRLMRHDGVNTVDKHLIVTSLARGLAVTGKISKEAMDDTERAILSLNNWGRENGCCEVYVFATEAVRSASNGGEMTARLQRHGIDLDVISGEMEARIGFVGAYTSGLVGIIDIGGASSELVIGDERGIKAANSAKIGAMRLLDLAHEDRAAAEIVLTDKLSVYGDNTHCDTLVGIGGTATTLAAVDLQLEVYDPNIVDGHVVTLVRLEEIIASLRGMSVEGRRKVKGLLPQRAEVIVSGGYILSAVMRKCGHDRVVVSERDNLEGYLIMKLNK